MADTPGLCGEDMRLCPIASGSSGNSIYVGTANTHILVDTGISKKRIEEGLNGLELAGHDIDAILITHEHSDHIQGLGVFTRKYPVPIYGTEKTLMAIQMSKGLGHISPELFHCIEADHEFMVGDIEVNPMKISHDAADPVAYTFKNGDCNMAVATDMGKYDDYIIRRLTGMDALLLESNHDIRMLQVGPYPYQLKQRILSDNGHLSNESCGRLLCQIVHDDLQHIFLGHLSHENNMPELAYETVRMEIEMGDCKYRAGDFDLKVAKRSEPSAVIEI